MTDTRTPQQPFFPVHCEMQDAANGPSLPNADLNDAPAAASVELAKLLHKYELHIDDGDRATLIEYGGRLLQLDRALRDEGLLAA